MFYQSGIKYDFFMKKTYHIKQVRNGINIKFSPFKMLRLTIYSLINFNQSIIANLNYGYTNSIVKSVNK